MIFLEGEDRFVDCSDFKKISKERFADLFSAEKQKGKINQQDVKKIKDLIFIMMIILENQ